MRSIAQGFAAMGLSDEERLVRQFPVYDALYAGRSKQGTVNRRPTRDLALANAAGFLRSFGVGLLGVVLGIYLSRVGLSSLEIGFVIAAGLAGSALATVVTSVAADRMGRRSFLVLLSFLTTIGGLALALRPNPKVLALMAFVGMLNGTGTDRSAAFALDQAVVPGLVSDTIIEPKLSDSMFQDRQEVVPGTNKQVGSTLQRSIRRLSPNG